MRGWRVWGIWRVGNKHVGTSLVTNASNDTPRLIKSASEGSDAFPSKQSSCSYTESVSRNEWTPPEMGQDCLILRTLAAPLQKLNP